MNRENEPRADYSGAGGKSEAKLNDEIVLSHKIQVVKLSPLKAIRAHCLSCCVGCVSEVKLCPIVRCDLHNYRFGRNPNRAGIGNKKGEKHVD